MTSVVKPNPDILIIGAGIIGMTAALALHRQGARVTIIDAGTPGFESTWAGGGIISPTPPWGYPEPVERLVARSRDLYPDLIETLQAATGIDCEYHRCKLLLLKRAMVGGDDWLRDHPSESGPAGRFEPALADPEQPAIQITGIAQVRNPRLARALWLFLESLDVTILTDAAISALWLEGGAVRGVHAGGRRIEAGRVVLACGAWTDRLLENSGIEGIGIAPVKGQMLLYRPGGRLIEHIVTDGRHYLVPRADGRILCGSTVETRGFDRCPTRAGYDELRAAAAELLPALAGVPPEAHWTGLRPGIAGGIPAIGAYPGVRGLWISAGHYRNGLGMAPAAAELLAGQIAGKRIEADYQPRSPI